MEEVIIQHQDLKEMCIKKFAEVDISSEHAEVVADVLIHANLRGIDSHGVLRMEHYIRRISEGGINPSPNIKINETGPASATVDGDDGLGHLIMKKAMDHAIKMAKRNGIGLISVINSSHCGALSYFVQQAAKEKMVGIAMTNTDKIVVPFGGAKPFFGTNPIAYGFPAKRYKPIILDMATSTVAYGKILNAKEKGDTIPENWAVNDEGETVTNPNDAIALLPFGGPKGYGLAMVVDIFSGILTGTAFGPHVRVMYGDYDQKRKLGHFIGVIDVSMFTEKDEFLGSIDKMIDELHESPPAKGFEKVMVPGEPESLTEQKRKVTGIPVPISIYNFLSCS